MCTVLNSSRVIWLTLTLGYLVGFTACKRETTDPAPDPEPAQAIVGAYQAKTFTDTSSPENYPINGQTVNLQIKRVTADTVQVDIQATSNGKYSPGQTLSYAKAVVTSTKHTDGTITYYVALTPVTECGYNTLYIYTNKQMDYNFIPPGNPRCSGARIRFEKL